MLRLKSPLAVVTLLLVMLSLNACQNLPTGVVPPTTPVMDELSTVTFYWSYEDGHEGYGSDDRLLLQGGDEYSVPGEIRLLNPAGQTVAVAQPYPAPPGLCGKQWGDYRASLPISDTELDAFYGGKWPAGYRLEVEFQGSWRPARLIYAGCFAVE